MNTKLIEQKRLMQKAIDNLSHVEQLERMGPQLPPDYFVEESMKYVDEYANIVQQLVALLLKDSGMVLKELPENKLAAIA